MRRALLRGLMLFLVAWGGTPSAPALAHESDRLSALESAMERNLRTDAARRGAKIFARACAACHGRRGRGDGPAAADLHPPPRNLSTYQFRFRTTSTGSLPRPEDLERTIHRGLPGSSMPAFDDLFSSVETFDLIHFIYSLQEPGSFDDVDPPEIGINPVPAIDPTTLRDGQAIYLIVGCWRCHGVNGAGNGPSARTLTDEDERRIRATDFRYDPFKGGRTPLDVVRALRTGLNGSPMPSYDEAMMIAREDRGDTVALEDRLSREAEDAVGAFLRSSPTRHELTAMSEAQRAELRERRLADLAHYVLSLTRRRGFYFRVFRERPERETRGVEP